MPYRQRFNSGSLLDSCPMRAQIIIVMGVSGTGKSTVGLALSDALGISFLEGDDYHSEENVSKMSQGIALTDDDRWAWLQSLNAAAIEVLGRKESAVISCSALKQAYRDVLMRGFEARGLLLALEGPSEIIAQRMAGRQHFFSGDDLLASQLAIYQRPTGESAFCVDVSQSLNEVVAECATKARARFGDAL
jgi:carbohydrate kinase (thermoresistant glucokinase family)